MSRLVADGKEPGSVPAPRGRSTPPAPEIRRRLERLDRLPLRPAVARLLLGALEDDGDEPAPELLSSPRFRTVAEADPAWAVAMSCPSRPFRPLELVEASTWWSPPSGPALEALERLWRHSVAAGQAARRLATEGGLANVEPLARAALLQGLGLWGVASVDPEWLVEWLAEPDRGHRRAMERRHLGTEVSGIGRMLAERWGCDPLIGDSAWLHADVDGSLNGASVDADALALLQQAFRLAERTPWSLFGGEARDAGGLEPRLRLLIAEVQVRCGSPFIEQDATIHEERLARSGARLRRQLAGLKAEKQVADGVVRALAESDPSEGPGLWTERAAATWCAVPGIATARVHWTGPGAEPCAAEDPRRADRPAPCVLTLADHGQPCAEIHLWGDREREPATLAAVAAAPAWQAWAALVARRARLEERLERLVGGHRDWVEREEPRVRRSKLDALAEFAAGAGHELNNPLAVIVGRAQLLLGRTTDPDAVRSLRAILSQAQRAHRILRDLMYVARTPEPRPRFCQADDVLRSSLRDVKAEAELRGVRLVLEGAEPGPKVWADPDALRQVADALIRNALESTREGGTIQVSVQGDLEGLSWTVKDNGRGIAAAEGEHLFDPFYCGRQAGRGLGLGLPRAARFVQQAGGELRWHSTPGQGATFHVHIPLSEPPKPPAELGEAAPPGSRGEPPPPRS